jgi:tRNA(fMet)-specific endonuclease VapC
MRRYMLDTDMCIYLMKHQPERVARRFSECDVGEVVMSAITYAELEYGVVAAADPASERQHLLALVEDIVVAPFDQIAGSAYGPVRYATRESRKDHLDKLIAAHAIALQVVLVTNNTKDFSRYPELRMENWLD